MEEVGTCTFRINWKGNYKELQVNNYMIILFFDLCMGETFQDGALHVVPGKVPK